MKKYSVYMLECADGSYYTGVTNNVFEREKQHNQGLDKNTYTFNRRPVKLVWHQDFLDSNQAIMKEKRLKGWGRKKKEALIAGRFEELPFLSKNSLRQAQTDNRQARLEQNRGAQTDYELILNALPYTDPFRFVDSLESVTDDGVVGYYTFRSDAEFYKGHFKNRPVTPGVLLTECCAQIGLVCLGIHLMLDGMPEADNNCPKIALSSSEMEYYLPVLPDETVRVESNKLYFRFNKLKCKVKMYNADNAVVCAGTLAGMIKSNE